MVVILQKSSLPYEYGQGWPTSLYDRLFLLKIYRDLPTKILIFNTYKHVSCVLISDNGGGGIKPT